MATTKLKIRQDLAKKSGGAPTSIYVQYCYEEKIKLFNTGQKIEPEFWDEKEECVKRSYDRYKGIKKSGAAEGEQGKCATSINNLINKEKGNITTIVANAQFEGIQPTLEYVQEQYELLKTKKSPEERKDFFTLYEEFLAENQNKKAFNTIRQQRTTLNHLKSFQKAKKFKITLDNIDLNFYEKFTSYLINEKQHTVSSVGTNIKNLKALLGTLTEKGINKNDSFRNRQFKVTEGTTQIITLSQGELDNLFSLDLKHYARLEKVRDIFLFGCVTGLRFSDIANLKAENISDTFIKITTVKTRDHLRVPLNNYAKAILAKYSNSLPEVISNQKMNDYLKELGKFAEINHPVQKVKFIGSRRLEEKVPKYELITTHTARRTFVTLSLEKGLRPETVMKMTGHKNIKMLMKYVRVTDNIIDLEMEKWDSFSLPAPPI